MPSLHVRRFFEITLRNPESSISEIPVGRISPIIFFVILPAVLIVIGLIFYRSDFEAGSTGPFIYVVAIVPVIYGRSRADYMEEQLEVGLEQAVVEYETVKKIVIVGSPILSIIIALYIMLFFIPHSPVLSGSLFLVLIPITGSTLGSLFLYLKIISKKEFRFYVARACFMTAVTYNKKDIFKQMYYFSLGLQEYDKFLKRRLKHQINSTDAIFSKVSLLNNRRRAGVIFSLYNSFEVGKESDKLKPVRFIASVLMQSKDIQSFLIPQSLRSQLKIVGAFLAASIPIVISSIPIVISIITLISRFFKIF